MVSMQETHDDSFLFWVSSFINCFHWSLGLHHHHVFSFFFVFIVSSFLLGCGFLLWLLDSFSWRLQGCQLLLRWRVVYRPGNRGKTNVITSKRQALWLASWFLGILKLQGGNSSNSCLTRDAFRLPGLWTRKTYCNQSNVDSRIFQ